MLSNIINWSGRNRFLVLVTVVTLVLLGLFLMFRH